VPNDLAFLRKNGLSVFTDDVGGRTMIVLRNLSCYVSSLTRNRPLPASRALASPFRIYRPDVHGSIRLPSSTGR
jgi:hypothetical protein